METNTKNAATVVAEQPPKEKETSHPGKSRFVPGLLQNEGEGRLSDPERDRLDPNWPGEQE